MENELPTAEKHGSEKNQNQILVGGSQRRWPWKSVDTHWLWAGARASLAMELSPDPLPRTTGICLEFSKEEELTASWEKGDGIAGLGGLISLTLPMEGTELTAEQAEPKAS